MSYHVFIANEGFKESPISKDHWHKVAGEICSLNDNLLLVQSKNRNVPKSYRLVLKNNKRQNLHRTPYGLISAQDPDIELIEVMFEIAKQLGSGVYNERLNEYKSPKDWLTRTRNYRENRDLRRSRYKNQRRKKLCLWLAVIVISLTIGHMISTNG